MDTEKHSDGGLLRAGTVAHRHVVEHGDGQVSAVVVRGVPALICDVCEEHNYEPEVRNAVVTTVRATMVRPGEAVAVDYRAADAT